MKWTHVEQSKSIEIVDEGVVVQCSRVRDHHSSAEAHMPVTTVLTVGLDFQLLRSRTLLLRSAGCIVVPACSVKEAIEEFRHGDFDLVLLCHSIPMKDREGLTCLIRASGSLTPVVTVADNPGRKDYFADATLESRPEQLLPGILNVLTQAQRAMATRRESPPLSLLKRRSA
jgi:CheY-like chemotaxis protein